jgi:ABC-type phosphate/phosphonate transport system permease subunit
MFGDAPIRALLAAIRTLPFILWAVFFVIMVGLGPFAISSIPRN